MRIDGPFIPGRDAVGVRQHEAGKRKEQQTPDQHTTVEATGDLVALFVGLNGAPAKEQLDAARTPLIERLKNAHQHGSIQVDSSRIASALLRFGYEIPYQQ